MQLPSSSPTSEYELLKQCAQIEGMSFAQLAYFLNFPIPAVPIKRKGWAGMAVELALGTTAGNRAIPDFVQLGIELKTLPLNKQGTPAESTFVTSISLLTLHQEHWLTSQCYQKLKRVLWLPIEGDKAIPFSERRIGQAILWSPKPEDEQILARDWLELTTLICTGKLEEINATIGEYLQIRPKAANARSVCYGFDSQGNKILTLPRGFYLRSRFTKQLISLS